MPHFSCFILIQDLYHVKAAEVGHLQSATLRLDQGNKEYSLTLDSLYVIHNAYLYHFDLHGVVLNKGQSKSKCQATVNHHPPNGKASYYIATHTADKMLAGATASFKIQVTGTKGMFGRRNELTDVEG